MTTKTDPTPELFLFGVFFLNVYCVVESFILLALCFLGTSRRLAGNQQTKLLIPSNEYFVSVIPSNGMVMSVVSGLKHSLPSHTGFCQRVAVSIVTFCCREDEGVKYDQHVISQMMQVNSYH